MRPAPTPRPPAPDPSEPTARQQREDTARHLASSLGWPFVDLEDYAISCGVLRRIPAELACRMRCVPFAANARRLVLAVDDPFNAACIAANQQLLGEPYRFPLEFALATPRGIDRSLERRLRLVKG